MTTPTATPVAPAAKTTRTRKPAAKPQPPITTPAPKVAPKRTPKATPAPAPEPVKVEPQAPEQPRAKTATDYRKEIDLAIITAAGELVKERVPAELREQVARLIANQLHHLSTPKTGWPSTVLPTPERSDWR